MKKPFIVTLGLICFVAASFAFTAHHDDPKYTNLKILPKAITEKQMDSVMHHFTASLGVRCNFCHMRNEATKQWDFASDENKHKLAAREMMKMTNTLNDKYFPVGGKAKELSTQLMVSCYTCHRGSTEPVTKAPHMERTQRPVTDSTRRNIDSTKRNG